MTPLIAVCGQKGHGKDTVGRMLAGKMNLRVDQFAAPIKAAAREWFGFTAEQTDGSLEAKETPDSRWGLTPRFVMQRIGTEVARGIHPDVWARAAIKRHHDAMAETKRKAGHGPGAYRPRGTVITDCRFVNEAQIVKAAGGTVIYVVRPTVLENEHSVHASEAEVEQVGRTIANFTVVNDRPLEELERNVLSIVPMLEALFAESP